MTGEGDGRAVFVVSWLWQVNLGGGVKKRAGLTRHVIKHPEQPHYKIVPLRARLDLPLQLGHPVKQQF